MKLFIVFVVVASLAGLLSAQPVNSSATNQLETSGVLRFKRMATLVKCPKNYTKLNRKCVHCDLLITFGLAFILCCAICFGLSIAIIAGIAYGYNYSMAEFMTFTRSDVTVFMRRGQFYDRPDVMKTRRSGSEDMFSTNTSTDYEDQKTAVESKPLAESWSKNQDTRRYAEILTRYNPDRKMNVQQSEAQESDNIREPPSPVRKLATPVRELPIPVRELPIPVRELPTPVRVLPIPVRVLPTPVRVLPTRVRELLTQAPPKEVYLKPASVSAIISIVPNPLMPTVSWQSGSSKIVMRNFQPLHEYTIMDKHTGRPESLFPTHSTRPHSIFLFDPKGKSKGYVDGKIRDDYENYVPMRVWGTTVEPVIPDEPEDVDEDNIVYKPV